MNEYDTKPTLETIVKMIQALDEKMTARFDALDKRLAAIDRRIDRLAGDFYTLRADLAETGT